MEPVDIAALKAAGLQGPCGFESHRPHSRFGVAIRGVQNPEMVCVTAMRRAPTMEPVSTNAQNSKGESRGGGTVRSRTVLRVELTGKRLQMNNWQPPAII
jgi:hypothetical protein